MREGLSCPMKISTIHFEGNLKLPFLRVSDFLRVLSLHEKLPVLWGNIGSASAAFGAFWRRYRLHDCDHEVYRTHHGRLSQVIPLQLHADEGQTLKKSAVMIFNWQSPIGSGTSKQPEKCDLNMNYLGNTYATRFLLAMCVKKFYKKNPERLDRIMAAVVDDICDLFYNGIELVVQGARIKMFVAPIGLKGDWPIHAKLGHLTRHFCRKGVFKVSSKSGICHLCRAGETDLPAHDYSHEAAWRATYLQRPPWNHEGPLCRLPQSPNKELMHKFDAFHTLHKGCFAELGGSGLATWASMES